MRATVLLALALIIGLVSVGGIIAGIMMDRATLDVFALIETACFGGLIMSCLMVSAAAREAERPSS